MTTSWRKIIRITSHSLLAVMGLGFILLAGGCASDGSYEGQSPSRTAPSRSGTGGGTGGGGTGGGGTGGGGTGGGGTGGGGTGG
jgi:hypothetical protein